MPEDIKKLDKNKEVVIDFYDLLFNKCMPQEAADKYIAEPYIQHNPIAADGVEAFVDYFNRMAVEYPGKKVVIKRIIAEGDLVVTHSHQHWPTDVNKDWAAMDIFRFNSDGKIVEHWDVLQIFPNETKNSNTMF